MSKLQEILDFNKSFVENKEYDKFKTSKVPNKKWLRGFDSVEQSIKESVDLIRNHPLIPNDIIIHGLIIDSETRKLEVIINGYT